jgi:predicted secreted Zn-dependent protease
MVSGVLTLLLCVTIGFVNPEPSDSRTTHNNLQREAAWTLIAGTVPRGAEVTISFYPVGGGTIPQVLREIAQRGPRDLEGIPRLALTRWHIRWNWPILDRGIPNFQETKATVSIEVTLPRLEVDSRSDPKLLRWWNEYSAIILAHERGHVDMVLKEFSRAGTVVREAAQRDPLLTPVEAHAKAHQVLNEIRVLDREYDRRTDHARKELAAAIAAVNE